MSLWTHRGINRIRTRPCRARLPRKRENPCLNLVSTKAQEAYKKNILNPEQTNHDPRKQKWVSDGFTNMTKENLLIPQRQQIKRKKLNTIGSITSIISKPSQIKDDANIDRLIQTIMASKRNPFQLAAFLGINVKVIRLICHQASKPQIKNDATVLLDPSKDKGLHQVDQSLGWILA